jgi:hypothetical protein
MALDPEVLAAIQETVKESFTEFNSTIESKFRELTRKQDSIKKDFTNIIDTQLNERFDSITPNLAFIEDVRKEYEEEIRQNQYNPEPEVEIEEGNKNNKRSKGKRDVVEETTLLEQKLRAEFEAKLIEDRKRVTELETQLKADQEKTREEQEKARLTSLRNDALNTIREMGLVSPGKENRLFTLLEQDGRLVKTEEGFKIAAKDKFGDDVQLAISEQLPELIKTSYDEYSIPRGGTGTGGVNTPRNNNVPTQDFSGLTAQQIYEQKNLLGADLIKTLEQNYSV